MDESPGVWGRTQSFVKGQPPPHDKKRVVEASSPTWPRGRGALASFIIEWTWTRSLEARIWAMMRHPKPLGAGAWLVHLTMLGCRDPKERAIGREAATFDSFIPPRLS